MKLVLCICPDVSKCRGCMVPCRQPDPSKKPEATERFQRLQHAYSVLRDPARRAQYDSTGRA